jgi:alpha-tubulin suppressor-like RCC1 family protein
LRSAVNVQEDPSGIISELQSRIEAIDNTVLLEKFALLMISLDIATTDRSIKVATVDDLPDSYTLPSGSVFFVGSIGVDVVAIDNKWFSLDGRLLRQDLPPADAMSWGPGGSGRLGDSDTIDRSSPVTVAGGITNWSAISAGNDHSLGLTDTGVLYAWGRGSFGRLGDETIIDKSSPVTVVGGITNWSQVSAGNFHSLGLTDAGVLYAWGDGVGGVLGDGTTIDRSSPVTVVGGITNWSAISAGSIHSLGLTDAGVLYAWGFGSYGQLGDETTISRSSPVTVVGGITNWSAISAGGAHSLGLKIST